MKNLLIMVPFREDHMEKINAVCGNRWNITRIDPKSSDEEILKALNTCEVVVGEPKLELLQKSSGVKWVQMTWAGTDVYTRAKTPFPKNICLTNASGIFGKTMSQYAVGQIISVMQRFPAYIRNQEKHLWHDEAPYLSLDGCTVLIYGAGNIGSETAKRLYGFNTYNIGVCQNTSKARDGFQELVTLEEAETILPKADVVIACIPNNEDTVHYFDSRRLHLLKKDAVLLNMGRGNFVDCDALNDFLNEGWIRGAVLDVTYPEPLPVDHPLWDNKRCVITPHGSGGSFGHQKCTEDLMCELLCENIVKYENQEKLRNIIY